MNQTLQMSKNVKQSCKQCNRNIHMATIPSNSVLLKSNQGVVTVAVIDDSDTQNYKHCLELQTTLKGNKIRMARSAIRSRKCMTQNAPLFGFIPIYGLKGKRLKGVDDRNENNICQNIIDLHSKLRQDGRYNYVGH